MKYLLGQIIGEGIRPGDLVLNVVKAKQLTNFRASEKMMLQQLFLKEIFHLKNV